MYGRQAAAVGVWKAHEVEWMNESGRSRRPIKTLNDPCADFWQRGKPAAPRKEAVTRGFGSCSCSNWPMLSRLAFGCMLVALCYAAAFPVSARVSVCFVLSACLFRVHAPSHLFLSRKPPGLTDAAYACQPDTLASLVFVSILARERPLRPLTLPDLSTTTLRPFSPERLGNRMD